MPWNVQGGGGPWGPSGGGNGPWGGGGGQTGPDIEEIHAWIDGRRGTPIRFPVLLDQRKRLAKAVNVTHYPTYIYFDDLGNEIDRSYSINNIAKWHNTRWLRKSGAAP